MYCDQCGAKMERNANFCANCGAAVEQDDGLKPVIIEPELPLSDGPVRAVAAGVQAVRNRSQIVVAAVIVALLALVVILSANNHDTASPSKELQWRQTFAASNTRMASATRSLQQATAAMRVDQSVTSRRLLRSALAQMDRAYRDVSAAAAPAGVRHGKALWLQAVDALRSADRWYVRAITARKSSAADRAKTEFQRGNRLLDQAAKAMR